MSLPWDDPNHDVLQDIIDFKNRAYAKPWRPQVTVPYKRPDSVAIVSGGLDSITMLYVMQHEGYTPHVLSFDYGQRHKKELVYARMVANRFNLQHDVVDLSSVTPLISRSALTSLPAGPYHKLYTDGVNLAVGEVVDVRDYAVLPIEVPEGHYAEDNMALTVVPNRNMIMLSIAAGLAVNCGYKAIGFGVHAGDHHVYPDCRPEFIKEVCSAIWQGTLGFGKFATQITFAPAESGGAPVYTPFLYKSKADIVYRAFALGVPLHLTWSCYKGSDKHCGRCGTCVERLEAIHEAQSRWAFNRQDDPPVDQTEYEDTEYWRVAVREKDHRSS